MFLIEFLSKKNIFSLFCLGLFSVASTSTINTPEEAFEILGITKDATVEQITKAYRKLAFQYHPDRNNGTTNPIMEKVNTNPPPQEVALINPYKGFCCSQQSVI